MIMIITMIFIGVNIGTATEHDGDGDNIPNYTLVQKDTSDTNGRAAQLDTEKEDDQLNPVERTIIKRDTKTSNQLKPNQVAD